MTKRKAATQSRSTQARIKNVTSLAASPGDAQLTYPSADPLKQAIDTERAQLMRAQAVIKTLSAALMNSEDNDAMFYVDAANVAVRLIDDAVGALDRIRMWKGVREIAAVYVRFPRLSAESRRALDVRGSQGTCGEAGDVWRRDRLQCLAGPLV